MDDKEALARSRARCGAVVGANYVLDDVIGIGGMGVVHAATQKSLRRTVAVKLPRPELANDDHVRQLFRNEALAGSRLSHRNAVCIHDFGDDDGTPYLVMEHIIGPRLGQVISERGALPYDLAIDLVRPIVSALEEAHGNGVIHADVKCDNIIVQTLRDGSVVPRLIDFGIARFAGEQVLPSQAERFVTGTPEYVAPEVACGEPPNFAADIYAIGVLLYELITNATPFGAGTAAAVMIRKLESEAMLLSDFYPHAGIPDELDVLISRALARDPAARPQSASSFGKYLDAVPRPSAELRDRVAVGERTIFSTEATTERMSASRAHVKHRASVSDRRARVQEALKSGSGDRVALAYLDLARALLDAEQPAAARAELEEGIALLMTPDGRGPVWRLLLALAALCERQGDRAKSRQVAARVAREQATRATSSLGR